MGLSTKGVGEPVAGSSVSKKLEPGNHTCSIVGIKLQKNLYDKKRVDPEYLMLILEGPDLGEGFEGFLIDKDNPDKGAHKGQVAWVKASEWAFADGTTKTGVEIKKDNDILRYLKHICQQTGCEKWFDKQDGKHETIQLFVEQMDKDKPWKENKVNVCIAGRQYKDKKDYMQWDLHLPKFVGKSIPLEDASIPSEDSRLVQFNENLHVKKYTPVSNFGGDENHTSNDTVVDPTANDSFHLD
jgi:hypothetical protein